MMIEVQVQRHRSSCSNWGHPDLALLYEFGLVNCVHLVLDRFREGEALAFEACFCRVLETAHSLRHLTVGFVDGF